MMDDVPLNDLRFDIDKWVSNKPSSKLQFLGFVSMHTKGKSTNKKINAFTIKSFILYEHITSSKDIEATSLNKGYGCTKIFSSHCDGDFYGITMPERLLQICHLLQLYEEKRFGKNGCRPSSYLEIQVPTNHTGASKVLKAIGFNRHKTIGEADVFCAFDVKMVKYHIFHSYVQYNPFVSHGAQDECHPKEKALEFTLHKAFGDIVTDWPHFPRDTDSKASLDELLKLDNPTPIELFNQMIDLSRNVLPFATITTILIETMKKTHPGVRVKELFLEILEDIEVHVMQSVPSFKIFPGDNDEVRLFCTKCDQYLCLSNSDIGTLFCEAPFLIMEHNCLDIDQETNTAGEQSWHAPFCNNVWSQSYSRKTKAGAICSFTSIPEPRCDKKPPSTRLTLPTLKSIINKTKIVESMKADAKGVKSVHDIKKNNAATRALENAIFGWSTGPMTHYVAKLISNGDDLQKNNVNNETNWKDAPFNHPSDDLVLEEFPDITDKEEKANMLLLKALFFHIHIVGQRNMSDLLQVYEEHMKLGLGLGEHMKSACQDLLEGVQELFPQKSLQYFKQSSTIDTSSNESVYDLLPKNDEWLLHRPLQVVTESLFDDDIIEDGKGWDNVDKDKWFGKTQEEEDDEEEQAQSALLLSSLKQNQEAMLINANLSKIRLEKRKVSKRKFLRLYDISCKFNKVKKRDPSFNENHKQLSQKPVFEATHGIVTLLDYDFVKNLKHNQWVSLPGGFVDKMKDSVKKARSEQLKSIGLIRSYLSPHKYENVSDNLFKVTVLCKSPDGKGTYTKTVYTRYPELKVDLSEEEFLLEGLTTLPSVYSHRVLHFGYGSKTHCISVDNERETILSPSSAQEPPNPLPSTWQNFWYSHRNDHHICAEGSIANLLYHIGHHDAAEMIKSIAFENNVAVILKIIGCDQTRNKLGLSNGVRNGQFQDPIKKCLWVLQAIYLIQRSVLDTNMKFNTPANTIRDLKLLVLPTILSLSSMSDTDGIACNHVVGFWDNEIIDYQLNRSYPLTSKNLSFACGYGRTFQSVTKGFSLRLSLQTWRKCGNKTSLPDQREPACLYSTKKRKNKKCKKNDLSS